MPRQYFECFECRQVMPLAADGCPKACPACGSTNGVTRTDEMIKRLLDHGAYYNVDPRTGGAVKKTIGQPSQGSDGEV